jgi:hypothetical protein
MRIKGLRKTKAEADQAEMKYELLKRQQEINRR